MPFCNVWYAYSSDMPSVEGWKMSDMEDWELGALWFNLLMQTYRMEFCNTST